MADSSAEPGRTNPPELTADESRAWFHRHRRLLLAIICITSIATAISGLWLNVPLESHEVFVAQTAEEMLERGDWLVPWLNDVPRLKKPPMNYWLVMAVDSITGGDYEITEWESRIPSALAAILLSIVTLLLGARLFDFRTGIVAALLLASSSGYMTYSHSARPEMVYALFCAAGLLAFTHAEHCWRDPTSRRHTKYFAWLGWSFFALGMLTKGPQLQIPILIGVIVALLIARRGRDILPILRPFTGLFLFAALSLWWYIAVYQLQSGATDVWFGETVSRVAERDKPITRYIDPYYLYRTGGLLLPWALFYFFAIVSPWSHELRSNRAAQLLWWIIITPMIILWLSLNRRWYYMLPILAPVCALMGAFALRWADNFFSSNRAWWWRNTMIGHVLALAGAIVYFSIPNDDQTALPIAFIILLSIATIITVVTAVRIRNTDRITGDRAFLTLLLLSAIVLAGAAAHGSLWSIKRYDVRESAFRVAEFVKHDDPLFGWRDQWDVEYYYLDRTIPLLEDDKQLIEAVKTNITIWLLVDDNDTFSPPMGLSGQLLFDVEYARSGGKQLWRITAQN